MAGETSLVDQVKTMQGYMGKFAKAIKDLTERVKVVEEKQNDDKDCQGDSGNPENNWWNSGF